MTKTTALTLFSLLAGSAAAFQSLHQQPATTCTTTALKASELDGSFGTTVETANKCPPAGAWIFDQIEQEKGKQWFRTSEIKHGRVAMVATIGYMIQKWGIHLPLYLGPSGSNAFHPESEQAWYLSESAGVTFSDIAHANSPLEAMGMVPLFGWYQVLLVAGWFELVSFNRSGKSEIPGDFGYDPLGFTKRPGGLQSEELKNLRLKELKNGRLAMIAIAGWVSNDLIPGAFPVPHP